MLLAEISSYKINNICIKVILGLCIRGDSLGLVCDQVLVNICFNNVNVKVCSMKSKFTGDDQSPQRDDINIFNGCVRW